MVNRYAPPSRTPAPEGYYNAVSMVRVFNHTLFHLNHKSMNVGPIGYKILYDFLSCGQAQPGLTMRLDLRQTVAVIRGQADVLHVHTAKTGLYVATASETKELMGKIDDGINLLLRQKPEKGEPSAEEKLGMLCGQVYVRNRGEANDPKLPDFLEVIEQKLSDQFVVPADLYVGAATAYRGRETEIAGINEYIDGVARKFPGEDKLALASRIAYRIIDMGQFDVSLLCGIVRHNRFSPGQAANLVDRVIEARALVKRESYETIRRHLTSYLDKAGYNVEQTADFLAILAKKREYGIEQVADLVVDAAKSKHLKSADAIAHLYEEVKDAMGYGRSQNQEFVAYLTRRGFFQKRV